MGRGGVFHARASAIGPSTRHNKRPPLYKALILNECDQSELEALETHGLYYKDPFYIGLLSKSIKKWKVNELNFCHVW